MTVGAVWTLVMWPLAAPAAPVDVERELARTVRPFVETYCIRCHGGQEPEAGFDISVYKTLDTVTRDHDRWSQIQERLRDKAMPPEDEKPQPSEAERARILAWIEAMRRQEAQRNAADPGLVLARRLSNAEYNYSIRDLTGVDIRPAREFPVDPANPMGFDNSGESLAMSPTLMAKYLQAAREVANHAVFHPEGVAFAAHPMLVETDRDKYCVQQIIDFYGRQATDYADYFRAAWRFKHRAALGRPRTTLARAAQDSGVSPKYLATVWTLLEDTTDPVGPLAALRTMWRELPAPKGPQASLPEGGAEALRDFVLRLRSKTAFKYTPLAGNGLRADGQPFLMWRNRQYAANRRSFDAALLQVEGEGEVKDPDLAVPLGQRDAYAAAFTRFCSVFPDAFYVSERGRYFPDMTRDKGRHLSAGFHNSMGYFRDDAPLYELLLDEKGQRELDALWRNMDFVASATARTYVQYYLNDSGEARQAATASAPLLSDEEIASAAEVERVASAQREKARATGNADAVRAVDEHFRWVNETIRATEKARKDAEPKHVAALQELAGRAYRRPLTAAERDELAGFYHRLREDGLTHEDAARDVLVGVLMSPDFCYRIDLVPPGDGVRALSDYALASRLSYFLWSSLPDAELLDLAAKGQLRRSEVLVQQARRMLKDDRVRGLATEFGGHWLDFRRFEQHNAVDRERFKAFDSELRQAMFEEPVRFLLDVVRENRPVLELVFGAHTFVNPVLARHYEMPAIDGGADRWIRVADADRYGRGGILPMSVFLTKNAPGLRTSPVKRGYWIVKQVLGEHIPPPPAVVPELPREEAKMELPLRDMLARHREDQSCASCHARFDSYGLALEAYGPVGERRQQDLAGRPVDDSATFPRGDEGRGLDGLRAHVKAFRQDDFVDNLSRKLLAYGLGRSLAASDDVVVESMRAKLARDGYRFASLVESVVSSPQFRTKRSIANQLGAGAGAEELPHSSAVVAPQAPRSGVARRATRPIVNKTNGAQP